MRQSKSLSVLLSCLTALFVLTGSIALPIVLRPFYYAHIGPLALEETTGLSREQIIRSYDEMMDFCTGRTREFSTGILPHSLSGRAHFEDVRRLFLLDLWAAAITGGLLLGWQLLARKIPLQPYRFQNRGFAFWGSVGLSCGFLLVGALAAVDFSRAFLVFHSLFFPGKTNWLFDPRTDPIINILPEVFFRNCAVFILVLMLLMCTLFILWDLRKPTNTD